MRDKRILLVEDDPNDEELSLRALKKFRIKNEIDVVRDGEEALDYLFCVRAHAYRNKNLMPQVILLDLKLPKIDGLDVLREIRANERTKLLPVIILTSSQEQKDMLKESQDEANSYVVKPVDTSQLMEAVELLGLSWMVINEGP